MTEAEVLKTVYDRLATRFDILQLVLFGSRARGDAKATSDYDVLVVANTDLPFIQRQGLALLALGPRDFSVDLLVYTPEEAAREKAVLGSAVYWALREGKAYAV